MKRSSNPTTIAPVQNVIQRIVLAVYGLSAIVFVASLGFSFLLAMGNEYPYSSTPQPLSSGEPSPSETSKAVDPVLLTEEAKRRFDRLSEHLALPAFDEDLETSFGAFIEELQDIEQETLALSIPADQRESHLELILTYAKWEERSKKILSKGPTSDDRAALQNEISTFGDRFFAGRTP